MKQIDPAILSESGEALDFAEQVAEFIVHQGMEVGAVLTEALFAFNMAKKCKVMLLTS
ncbi:hypothetical protein [Aquibacillus kalidii]|uniref:hypothetical protein n=1 Tax=Aquibacillus kalidii TaxID=2762597 RepID=UPI00164558C0|nr:hypothetical protein [Aquibacillus kalidii]